MHFKGGGYFQYSHYDIHITVTWSYTFTSLGFLLWGGLFLETGW